jgi:hypothetical protein
VIALEVVQRLLESIQDRSLSVLAQAEHANIIDQLLPYRLTTATLLMIMALFTASTWLGQMTAIARGTVR